MRMKSLERLQTVPSGKRTAFSVTFSGDPDTYEAVKTGLMQFVKGCEAKVKATKRPEQVFQINLDLLPWDDDE